MMNWTGRILPTRVMISKSYYTGKAGTLAITAKAEADTTNSNEIAYLGPEKLKFIVENLDKLIKNTRYFIVEIFGCEFPDYPSNILLCEDFREKLTSMNAKYCFITEEQLIICLMLIAANIDGKLGETIAAVYLSGAKCDDRNVTIMKYQYTKDGWKKVQHDEVVIDDKNNVHCIREIVRPCKHVLLSTRIAGNILFKVIKKAIRVVGFQWDILCNRTTAINELTKSLADKSYLNYYVLPSAAFKHRIMNSACEDLLTVDVCENVPISKACIIPKSVDIVLIQQINKETGKIETKTVTTNQKCHRNAITFSIDADNFSYFDSEAIMLPQIECLRKKLNEKMESKIPVIGFCDNFSVICVHQDEENGYKFVKEWNGIYGNELVISFCQEQPIFGEEALKAPKKNSSKVAYDFDGKGKPFICEDQKKPIFGASKKKPFCTKAKSTCNEHYEPGHVVYDLIKIMAMPPSDIKVEDRWGFRIIKDDKHPVLLEFESHASPPFFLMAMLLKQHIKVIKNEIGEKPEKLGFCILDEKYSNDEKQRIKDGLEKACEALKIEFCFVGL